MDKTKLKEIIREYNTQTLDSGLIIRESFDKLKASLKNPFVIIISGIRRAGKSTLLKQLKSENSGYYLNFDDDRLIKFKVEDFQDLYEAFTELYGDKDIFYFDEVQNVSGWERFVRRLHDNKKKVFVTGSNASLLSRELGTHLTGRHLELKLFPFSFREFLELKGLKRDKESAYLTGIKAKIKTYFEEYFINGGFPEYLSTHDREYLKTLYENILYRDIMARYKLTNDKLLKELVYLATTNISKEISFNSLKKLLNMGSSTTVKDYFDHLENSYLIFLLPKFDYSLKKQIYSNKKVYLIDTAMAIHLGYRTSKDLGKLLENLVFIELKRRGKEVYYYREKNECDFVVKDGLKIREAIQVTYVLEEDNEKREINGLLEAMEKLKLKEGIILTHDQQSEKKIGKKKIKIIPVWKWLLDMHG